MMSGATPTTKLYFSQIRCAAVGCTAHKSKLDDHSKSVPPLPIPNRTVKRLYADDSAATSVKVGYRQASYLEKPQLSLNALKIALSAKLGFFAFTRRAANSG